MANSICDLVKVKSRKIGHIYNVKNATVLQNGFVGIVGNIVSGEQEVYDLNQFATATIPTATAVMVYMDEILYDESTYTKKQLGQFSIEANTICKGYELNVGDVVEISYDGVTLLATDAVVGNFLIAANASYKLAEIAASGTAKTVLKIEAVETVGLMTYVGSNGQVGNTYKKIRARVLSV
ncbi:MAG TPA: hypothetical protein VIM70_01580 [Clostridium sp.]|uniref:hypothetical protein n=1 Tax=Clostridium sp. TaxID=1506 RepID=UPI002F94085B